MPTSHKPIKDHKPLNLNEEIRRLEECLEADLPELIAIARKGKPLEDDQEAIYGSDNTDDIQEMAGTDPRGPPE